MGAGVSLPRETPIVRGVRGLGVPHGAALHLPGRRARVAAISWSRVHRLHQGAQHAEHVPLERLYMGRAPGVNGARGRRECELGRNARRRPRLNPSHGRARGRPARHPSWRHPTGRRPRLRPSPGRTRRQRARRHLPGHRGRPSPRCARGRPARHPSRRHPTSRRTLGRSSHGRTRRQRARRHLPGHRGRSSGRMVLCHHPVRLPGRRGRPSGCGGRLGRPGGGRGLTSDCGRTPRRTACGSRLGRPGGARGGARSPIGLFRCAVRALFAATPSSPAWGGVEHRDVVDEGSRKRVAQNGAEGLLAEGDVRGGPPQRRPRGVVVHHMASIAWIRRRNHRGRSLAPSAGAGDLGRRDHGGRGLLTESARSGVTQGFSAHSRP